MSTELESTSSYASNKLSKDLYILRQLVTKDFKLKYRRSVLGVVWSVLNPLLMMIIMSIVFSYLFSNNIEHYPLYLILGNITFTLMSDSTSAALTSIIDASPLLKKVKVDRFVFPVQKALFALVNFAFSLVAVAIVMAFFRVPPTWNLLWLPVVLLLLMLFCIGIGMLIGALAVFFRDVIHLWSVVLTAWTYLTPLFWDFQMLLDRGAPGWTIGIIQANPMYHFVTFIRDIFLWQQGPDPLTLISCVCWAVGMLVVGMLVFRKLEHKFILYI